MENECTVENKRIDLSNLNEINNETTQQKKVNSN